MSKKFRKFDQIQKYKQQKKKYIKHKKIANYNSYLDIDISVACILLKDEILILKNKNTCISSDFSKHLCCILRIFKNNL